MKLSLFYKLKPLMPRGVQLTLRRAYTRTQRAREFPAWPVESLLVDRQTAELRARLEEAGVDRLPFVNFWPAGQRFCSILTHDVEGVAGIENIPRVLEVEQRHGFVSSWNFVAEDYPIDGAVFDLLREAGCEVGLHALHHDGKLFESRQQFVSNLPGIHDYLKRWEAVGFRSPATHRLAEWMPELRASYDTSFPDTDPFEPQSGGCCSIFPYFLGDTVELPITLTQDHTLWEVLRDDAFQNWTAKSKWIIENHGLITLLIHPDYVLSQERLDEYERFLVFLKEQEGGWHPLPRDAAGWWRRRAAASCRPDGTITADDATLEDATVAWARAQGDGVAFELSSARVN